ncbi:hypothetical protein V7P28_01670, partial [Klebsiella michiganensis]
MNYSFGDVCSPEHRYRGSKERLLLRTFEKATLPGGFFVSEQETTTSHIRSQAFISNIDTFTVKS